MLPEIRWQIKQDHHESVWRGKGLTPGGSQSWVTSDLWSCAVCASALQPFLSRSALCHFSPANEFLCICWCFRQDRPAADASHTHTHTQLLTSWLFGLLNRTILQLSSTLHQAFDFIRCRRRSSSRHHGRRVLGSSVKSFSAALIAGLISTAHYMVTVNRTYEGIRFPVVWSSASEEHQTKLQLE